MPAARPAPPPTPAAAHPAGGAAGPDLAVVIPAYNEARYLPDCLAALRGALAGAGVAAETIVADDGSTDGTADAARAAGVRVVRAGARNIAAARNAGAAAAGAPFLLFLDADCRVNAPLLAEAVAVLRTGTVAGGGAAFRYDVPALPARLAAGFWNAVTRVVDWAAGSFLFCRRDAFRAIRGFDARLYASEEIDFCQRLGRWARARNLRFVTLRRHPYVTSARKLAEFTLLEAARQIAMGIDRSAFRDRRKCPMWYDVRR